MTEGGDTGFDDSFFSGGAHQHGSDEGHLPGSSANVELIGELEPMDEFGPIVPGQIADLAVYKDFAYLDSRSEETCTKGGVYVVDIRNPRKPKEVDFIPAVPGNFHGEGAHVISVNTRTFTGDLLAVNNEKCTETNAGGGFDLYDVTDPRNPKTLVQGAGDHGGEGRMNGTQPSNTYHSAFMWQDDGKVYLVGTDNEEFHDVDIFRHHESAGSEAGRRIRRELPADITDGGAPPTVGDLQPRHGGEGRGRPRCAARLLLGCGLRDGRRREPREGHIHRRHRLRERGSPRAGHLAA